MKAELHQMQAKLNRVVTSVRAMGLRHMAIERILRRSRWQFAVLLVKALFIKDALMREIAIEEGKIVTEHKAEKAEEKK